MVLGFRPGGAARHRRAAPFAAAALALVQSAFVVASRNQLAREGAMLPPGGQIVLFSVGGTLAMIAIGAAGSRFGVGSGYLVVQAADMLASAPARAPLEAGLALAFALVLLPLLSRRRSVSIEPLGPPLELRLAPPGSCRSAWRSGSPS